MSDELTKAKVDLKYAEVELDTLGEEWNTIHEHYEQTKAAFAAKRREVLALKKRVAELSGSEVAK